MPPCCRLVVDAAVMAPNTKRGSLGGAFHHMLRSFWSPPHDRNYPDHTGGKIARVWRLMAGREWKTKQLTARVSLPLKIVDISCARPGKKVAGVEDALAPPGDPCASRKNQASCTSRFLITAVFPSSNNVESRETSTEMNIAMSSSALLTSPEYSLAGMIG